MNNSEDIPISNVIAFKNILRSEIKWYKLIKDFNKDCNIYYQYIEPRTCDFELYLTFQKELIIHDAKVSKKINIKLNDFIPDNINNGVIKIIDNVLIYIETNENFKPIPDQTFNINKCVSMLSNQKFLDNADPELIKKEKIKLNDFKILQAQKNLNNIFNKFGIDFIYLILKFHSFEKIYWHIQFYRELITSSEEYSKEWFDYIYSVDIEQFEIDYLTHLSYLIK